MNRVIPLVTVIGLVLIGGYFLFKPDTPKVASVLSHA